MKKLLLSAILGLGVTVSAGASAADLEGESVSILYPSWAEGVAMTHLADVALSNHGAEVKTTLLEPGPLFATLAKGDGDILLDAWLPNTHSKYWERFGDKLENLGTIFDDASTGLVVPEYVDIDSIDELNDNKDKFDGKIHGIGSGAGIHGNTLKVIEEYPLEYRQITSSESAMMSALRKAIKAEDPIIVTGWKPHYMWDIYDLKMLEDPNGIYESEEINAVARKGFKDDSPVLGKFFSNFSFSDEKLHELIGMVREADQEDNDPKKGAKAFYDKYQDEIDGWLED